MKPGTQLGHYEILTAIGSGGMGEVWRARDTKLGREVAIKFVHPLLAAGPHAVERLRIEARAASGMNHPNICTIHDFSEHDGVPYIVMELMKGKTLQDRLDEGRLKPSEVVDIGIQAADALAAAHERGIIHRDIKPANIFMADGGLIKIMDFGLAKLLPQHGSLDTANTLTTDQLTSSGAAVGTVSYMSPEQASGEQLDGRTDLFSLGIVLYTCATGHAPFQGKTAALVLSSILNRSPISPLAINPEIPPRLANVIDNCLEKDRELRYQAAGDLRADLKRVKRDLDLQQLEITHRRVPVGGADGSVAAPVTGSSEASDPAAPSSKSKLVLPAALVMILVAAASFYLLYPDSTGTADNPVPDAAVPDQPPESVAAEDTLELAVESLAAGTFRQALSYAEAVLAAVPDHPRALAIRDEAQSQVNRFDEAASEARRWIDAGNPTRAGEALDVARGIDPADPEVARLYASVIRLLDEQAAEARAEALEARLTPVPAPGEAAPAAAAPRVSDSEAPVGAGQGFTPVAASEPALAESVSSDSPETELEASAPAALPEPQLPASAPPALTEAVDVVVQSPSPAEVPPPVAPAADPTPPTGTAGEAPDTRVDDESEIMAVIATYALAIETKDLALFREVKPDLSEEETRRLTQSFSEVDVQQVDFTIVSLELDGGSATVRLNRIDTIELGGTRQSTQGSQTLQLVRSANGWIIDSIGE